MKPSGNSWLANTNQESQIESVMTKRAVVSGGAERQRNTGGARSSRARSALHKKLRKLDRKISEYKNRLKYEWPWTAGDRRRFRDRIEKMDGERKETRNKLKYTTIYPRASGVSA